MTSPGVGHARVARGLTLSGLCLLLSLLAHVGAGGSIHVSLGLVLGGLGLSAICVAAADARRGFGAIIAVVGVSQIVFHLLAGLGGHHTHSVGQATTPVMLTYHAVATVLISAMLTKGETLIWSLFSLLRITTAWRLVQPPPSRPSWIRPTGLSAPRRMTSVYTRQCASLRGPPEVCPAG
ncbi:hypothetical protein [Phytoactinopolyspora limicola]|uniref:hypothetical protein n=1 Tax=Phytoactinopolyspora limicola TaxID=2715536 RepID=UPI00140DB5C7|nr:hypothetical protein [Phytoactinopolyspora limicola]